MSIQDLQTTAAALTSAAFAATAAATSSASSAFHTQAAIAHQNAASAWVPTGDTRNVAQHGAMVVNHNTSATTLKAAGK